jgi:hypothetical protein
MKKAIRNLRWKKLALSMLSGSMLFQVVGCAETAAVVTSLSSVFTAGGVLYLVWRVTE